MMDAIDTLAGIAPGSALDVARARRPIARTNAQASYDALLHPVDPTGVASQDRFAVAVFVAGLHRDSQAMAFYGDGMAGSGAVPALATAIEAAADAAAGQGPYGSFPAGPLSREDAPGPVYRVAEPGRGTAGPRLAAALEHAHMLVFHPRDAAPEHVQALLDAGWSTPDIVTLSQLVSFLSFQIRVATGLRTLAATMLAVPAGTEAHA